MKYPMQIYVVWQPNSTVSVDEDVCFKYAKAIFSTFNRTIDDVLDRDIGIPTYFISVAGCLSTVIDWEEAERTVVVWMINEVMVVEQAQWQKDVETVLKYKNEYDKQVNWIGVSLTKSSGNFCSSVNCFNRIELQDELEARREEVLLRRLIFKVAQELYDRQKDEPLPLTLFLSHARKDGKHIAKAFNTAVQQIEENVNTFLDVRNIEVGADIGQKIANCIGKSVLVVIDTNAYSERDWCLEELLEAKKHNRPIVVVNAQKNLIKRTSPYLGNTAKVCSTMLLAAQGTYSEAEIEQEYKRITQYVLRETVRYMYDSCLLTIRLQEKGENVWEFPAAPELLTIYQKNTIEKKEQAEPIILVYPDPPLINRERKLLEDRLNILPITSTLYPVFDAGLNIIEYTSIFSDLTAVGISISEIISVKDGLHQGIGIWHLQDAMVELTRYLLACGATCAYAGNLQYPFIKDKNLNFTIQLIELLKAYNSDYKSEKKIINHVAAPYVVANQSNLELKAEVASLVEFVEHTDEYFPKDKEDYSPAQKAASFTYMRQQMFHDQNEAQIFIGGKTEQSQSIILGIVEEAYYALKYRKPIYIVGAFGGVSQLLAELFLTGASPQLSAKFETTQASEDWKQMYQAYIQYIQEHPDWEESPEEIQQRVDYSALKLFFLRHRNKQQGNYLHNGLSKEENEILFRSKNMLEITSLIIKGLYQYLLQ
jgi:hypothetical protein